MELKKGRKEQKKALNEHSVKVATKARVHIHRWDQIRVRTKGLNCNVLHSPTAADLTAPRTFDPFFHSCASVASRALSLAACLTAALAAFLSRPASCLALGPLNLAMVMEILRS